MSCDTLNLQPVNLNVSVGALPEGFCPSSEQERANAIASRLIINPNSTTSSFAIGSIEPSSNVGPWLKDCLTWYIWDDNLSRYVPMSFPSIASIQTGFVEIWAGTVATIPSGYLFCDGTEYNQSQYPALFGVIGTQYGSTSPFSFKVPDLRDSFIVGARQDNAGTAQTMVSDGATLTKSRVYTPHTHTVTLPDGQCPPSMCQAGTNLPQEGLVVTTSNESPRAIPPYVSMVYMIKT